MRMIRRAFGLILGIGMTAGTAGAAAQATGDIFYTNFAGQSDRSSQNSSRYGPQSLGVYYPGNQQPPYVPEEPGSSWRVPVRLKVNSTVANQYFFRIRNVGATTSPAPAVDFTSPTRISSSICGIPSGAIESSNLSLVSGGQGELVLSVGVDQFRQLESNFIFVAEMFRDDLGCGNPLQASVILEVSYDQGPPQGRVNRIDGQSGTAGSTISTVNSSFLIEWSATDDASGVNLYYPTVSINGGPWSPLPSSPTSTTQTSYQFNNAALNSSYCFKVESDDRVGWRLNKNNAPPDMCVTRIPVSLNVLAGSGNGSGSVSGSGISCGINNGSQFGNCQIQSATGTVVTLTAQADAGSSFAGWGGACAPQGTSSTCQLTVNANTIVSAGFNGPQQLSVSIGGAGGGQVGSSPAGIACPATCQNTFPFNTVVTLTANPTNNGSTFGGWTGACTGSGTCQVTMSQARSVTATFNPPVPQTLSVSIAGSGTGSVTSSPAGITCPGTCQTVFDFNTVVTLTPAPGANSMFGGWSGDCAGTGGCQVTLNRTRNVTATFNPAPLPTLSVAVAGAGSGTVSSSPAGISCPGTCTSSFALNTVVTLSANPTSGSTFGGWAGVCTGAGTCQVTMSQAQSVSATFNPPPPQSLTVAVGGTGNGNVTSSPAGISCPGTCTSNFAFNTVVTLSPSPTNGSTFGGWTGACSGTGICQVSMSQTRSVTATFNPPPPQNLAVTVAGMGTGSVTSVPGGINCPGVCQGAFALNTVVTLTASPSGGSSFAGWSGACTGTGACQLTMSQGRSVTATFDQGPNPILAVTLAGMGTGNVVSSPAGISCPSTCNAAFAVNTVVTLTATPTGGSTFAGWDGACTGSATCQVTLAQARSVTATFIPPDPQTLTVTITGTGTGSVTSSPTGVSCPGTCQSTFAFNTAVTLTASPTGGSSFTGWSGGCVGNGTCQVTMSQVRNVTATFATVAQPVALSVSALGNGTGTVTSAPAGINCSIDAGTPTGTCSATYPSGTPVTLTQLEGGNLVVFKGWGGACSGIQSCSVTMDQPRAVSVNYILRRQIWIVPGGPGSGVLTVQPTGLSPINCSYTPAQTTGNCSDWFEPGTQIMLAAQPGSGSNFGGWGAPCGAANPCTTVVPDLDQIVRPQFVPPENQTLTVTLAGSGTGTVTSSPSAINCPATCQTTFPINTQVTLTPTPTGGSTFAGWGGACGGTGTCQLTLSQARSVTATFDPPSPQTLTVTIAGAGTGSVSSSPSGINCPGSCQATFAFNTLVTLAPTPTGGSAFNGWNGACSGTGTCQVTMAQARSVTAVFAPPPPQVLTVATAGAGIGTVTSSPAGISCPGTCQAAFTFNLPVTLTATPTGGSSFAGWSGACAGTGSCQVTMNQAHNVTATFGPPEAETLTVILAGTGAGAVTFSSPAGINCQSDCQAVFPHGSTVTLTAAPAGGSTFGGWSGACTGTGPCQVTMTQGKSVTATFDPPPSQSLTVTTAGAGSGTVTSSPTGISCPGTCQAPFTFNSTVTLLASPSQGSVFTGWTGACGGSGPCQVAMSQAQTVTATFEHEDPQAVVSNMVDVMLGKGTFSPPEVTRYDCNLNSRFDLGDLLCYLDRHPGMRLDRHTSSVIQAAVSAPVATSTWGRN